jgi:hypothetical protein
MPPTALSTPTLSTSTFVGDAMDLPSMSSQPRLYHNRTSSKPFAPESTPPLDDTDADLDNSDKVNVSLGRRVPHDSEVHGFLSAEMAALTIGSEAKAGRERVLRGDGQQDGVDNVCGKVPRDSA